MDSRKVNGKVRILSQNIICAGVKILMPKYADLVEPCIVALESIKGLTAEISPKVKGYMEKKKQDLYLDRMEKSIIETGTNFERTGRDLEEALVDVLNFEFNRPMTDEEYDDFFSRENIEKFTELYGGDYPDFHEIEVVSGNDEVNVGFEYPTPLKEAIKISYLVNEYFKIIANGLEVKEVYILKFSDDDEGACI